MPELPEIIILARQMEGELVGKTIHAIEVLQPKSLNTLCYSISARSGWRCHALMGRLNDHGCKVLVRGSADR